MEAMIAQLYARWILDIIIEAVILILHNIAISPRTYRHVDGDTYTELSMLRNELGSNRLYPSSEQREAYYNSIFDPTCVA